MKPIVLDLFCGAGGASMGYARAGFEVVGVDIAFQPNYPFRFIQADAMTFPLDGFDGIHASPPCQRYSSMTKKWDRQESHPDLIGPTRDRLAAAGVPWVIENVVGAPLREPVTLCGTMFGLAGEDWHLRRHRLFEASFPVWPPASCAHRPGYAMAVYGHPGGSSRRDPKARFGSFAEWKLAMGVDWMSASELAEAIPPAYTEHIGRQLLELLDEEDAA